MLYAISIQLGEALAARKVPYRVTYGPEPIPQGITSPHIVILRDRKTGDHVTAPRQTSAQTTLTAPNPHVVMNRFLGATCRVFAKSTKASAIVADHERIADQVIDQVLVALRSIVNARRNTWTLGAGHLLTDDEIKALGLEAWPGGVYEQAFSIDRGVTDRPYAGESTAAHGEPTKADEAIMGTDVTTVATTIDDSESPGVSTTLPDATTRIDS